MKFLGHDIRYVRRRASTGPRGEALSANCEQDETMRVAHAIPKSLMSTTQTVRERDTINTLLRPCVQFFLDQNGVQVLELYSRNVCSM